SVAYSADMRYVGQAYELPVPIVAPVASERVPEIVRAFHAVHDRVYGYARTQQPTEFVNFRAVHDYPLPRPVVRPAAPAGGAAIDPVLLEVLRNRLDAIADEMELTLLKSAASPIVKEGLDASAALFSVQGETIAQAAAIPIHLGALQFAAQRIVRAFPPERMQDGDAFLLNDPYDGGTHLPDITLAVPVFAEGRPAALACTMCHHQDVGGRTPGSVPTDATELYQEGIIIPP